MTAPRTLMLLAGITALGGASARAQDFDRSRVPAAQATPKMPSPDVHRRTLPNGLELWVVERHDLPIVNAVLTVRAGAANDGADAGLATVTAGLLDEGSTRRSGPEFARAVEGLGISLFERLMALHGHSVSRMLTVQYRMNEAIMAFPSRELYDDRLQADASVCEHVLAGLPGVAADEAAQSPIEFVDTAGASFDEEVEPGGESRLNRQEADLVCRKVRRLLDCGVEPRDIAVIAPYAAQVRLLRERLSVPGMEIDSVDGFQGREKEAVLISLVRSNPQGEIGFLQDVRRMNVAMTRARRKLLLVGDSATLSAHPFYRRMIEYFEGAGAYRTVWEEDVAP